MQNTLLVVAAMLLLTNAATMYYAYRIRNRLLEEEKTLEGCASSIRSLEREIFEKELERQRLEHTNIELSKSNRFLKTKLEKINNQVKQISDHFKTN